MPPKYNSISSTYSGSSILNDPAFSVVSDPEDANAVYYPCGHAAVLLSQGCFIEKVGYGSELLKHGILNGSCGAPTSTTVWLKYNNRGPMGIDETCLPDPDPEPDPCDYIDATWISGGSGSVYTFNYTSSYFNKVKVECELVPGGILIFKSSYNPSIRMMPPKMA